MDILGSLLREALLELDSPEDDGEVDERRDEKLEDREAEE